MAAKVQDLEIKRFWFQKSICINKTFTIESKVSQVYIYFIITVVVSGLLYTLMSMQFKDILFDPMSSVV